MEFALGAFVMIGIFVFYCDVTDSWNNLFRWTKIGRRMLFSGPSSGSTATTSRCGSALASWPG